MIKLIYKGIIEDVRFGKCTERELESLVGVFEYVVSNIKIDSDFESYQSLENFYENMDCDVSQFSLNIERKVIKDKVEFIGKFNHENKNLKIIATKEEY